MPRKKTEKPRVLFVDDKNDLASQIAEHFAGKLFGDSYDAYSAGPAKDIVDCDLIAEMYAMGEDIRRQASKDFRDTDYLPADARFDYVVYLSAKAFEEWSGKTPWKGRQILCDMGSRESFGATDDLELSQCYAALVARVRSWVEENMRDEERLRSLISA
ncbi:MAG: hypothetical protein LBG62_05875 [Candidatus Methanoplasma sp.]|jgi:protein-tyrosine-phosphatase|nr:hypothetical protein [Candidatus Methanoplasma sp.]